MKRWTAWMLALCMAFTVCPALAEDVATGTDLPAWDEAACDHMNVQCEQSPACEVAGCIHMGQDAHGLDVPLCDKGRWVIQRQNAAGVTAKGQIDLNAGDAVIWRGGTYEVTGGEARTSSITVKENLNVCLRLRKAKADTVTVENGASLTLETSDVNSVAQLNVAEDADVTFAGRGAVRVDAVMYDPQHLPAALAVRSGSVQATMEESNGRTAYRFAMGGASAVTVDGKDYPACADEQGEVWLWLAAPGAGAVWQADVVDGVLAVAQTVPVTEAPVTEAPVTEAPATEAPVTEAPVTETPVTEVPATEAPVTEAPATEAPVTEAPVTEAPATEAPVTEAPATEVPVTEAPVTEAPATEAPATEAPATEAPWDESQCDHVTLDCENAPKCDIAGCEHIGQDVHGLDIPLCEAGEWLLNQEDAFMQGVALYSIRSTPIDLSMGDAVIWRSGSYTLLNGTGNVTVAGNRVVILTLDNAKVSELKLGQRAQCSMIAEGRCQIDTITSGEEATLVMNSQGHLTVTNPISLPVQVLGGSVKATLTETEGRQLYGFVMSGCKTAKVAALDMETAAAADGVAYLWLPAPAEGMEWATRIEGETLLVEQTASIPEGEPVPVQSGAQMNAVEGRTYLLTGIMDNTALVVDVPGVTVLLDGVDHAGDVLVKASVPYTLIVKTASRVASLEKAQVVAEATLTVSGAATETNFASGSAVLMQIPAGYETYETETPVRAQALTMDGTPAALLMSAEGKLLLPVPAEGDLYTVSVTETSITVQTLHNAYDLAKTPEVNAGNRAEFTVTGAGKGTIKASGSAEAKAKFTDMALEGTLTLENETLSVDAAGVNVLKAETDAILLQGESKLVLATLNGNLTLYQQNMVGLELTGNIRVVPEVAGSHLCVTLKDKQGNAPANRAVQVMLGDKLLECQTFEDGTLHLWGLGDVTGKAMAITDGENVYTAVITGTSVLATTGLTIDQVLCEDMPDGTVRVTVACEGMKSAGVQVSYTAADTPDTFDAAAARIPMQNGTAILTDVQPGQAITLRVYVSAQEGAALTADNADGFQFSEQVAHIHRVSYPVDQKDAASVVYTGKAYVNPLKLPQDAKVTYTGKQLNEYGMPVDVGDYVMHVEIPQSNTSYLPGIYDIPFCIGKIQLHIIPEPNQEKYAGDPDPAEFPFTVEGLLYYDAVGGVLIREEGEEPGNYRFLTRELVVKDYYEPIVYSSDPVFTILPAPTVSWGGGGMMGEVLRPIRQTIVKKNGDKVSVMLNTAGNLRVSGTDYGCVVRASDTDFAKNVRPSLSYNEEEDLLLLRLRTEPDVNKDGGYATGDDGKVIWSGRCLRITYDALRMLRNKGIDAISLNVKEAALTVQMEELFSDEVMELVKSLTRNTGNAFVRVEIIPVTEEIPEDITALLPVTDGWHMAVYIQVVQERYDITSMLPGTTMQVDLEPVAELLDSVSMYDEDTFAGAYTLAVKTEAGELWPVNSPVLELPEDEEKKEPLEVAAQLMADKNPLYVAPFQPDELDKVVYPTMLYTHRYLTLPVPEALTVWCVRTPAELMATPQPEETAAPVESK